MRAIILAAGLGRRMVPLTNTIHKTLLEIGGRAILARILDALLVNNIKNLTIVTGYRAAELHDFVNLNYPELNLQWIHNEKYETTNNIYSLSLALDQIKDEDSILIESDLVFDPSVITTLLQSPYEATALVSLYELGMDGTVVSLSGDVVTAIHPPHLQGNEFSFKNKYKTLNIYKFSKCFTEQSLRKLANFYAKSVDDNCYYELVLGVMIYMQSSEIHAIKISNDLWSEIDDPVDMQTTNFKFNTEQRLSILDSSHGAYWNYAIHDFCHIRNDYFPNEGMFSMLRHNLSSVIKSYGSSQASVDRKMSYFIECNENKVVSLNGSSQIFPWLKEYCAGQKILLPKPTFGEYGRTMSQCAFYYDDRVGINLSLIEDQFHSQDIIVFVNPNNPTGSIIPTEDLIQIISRYSKKLFIVDESFIDFSHQPSLIDYLKKNDDCKNILVIKSLGKALGVPGLRLGFVYSNDNILMGKIRDDLPIWNLNSLAEYFLELLLKNRVVLKESFDLVKKARFSLEQKLKEIPFIDVVYPSHANFLLVKTNKDLMPELDLSESMLQKHNIYIKDVSAKFAAESQYFRFAVRKSDLNEKLLNALLEIAY